jgi:TolB protein
LDFDIFVEKSSKELRPMHFDHRPGSRPFGFACHILAASLAILLASPLAAAAVGEFESAADVGKVDLKGSAEYDAAKAQYKVTGSGENMWKNADAFQFVSRKMSGDIVFTMDVEWIGEGKDKHRKACAMIRQGVDADAAYVDVAVHGDGSISLQYRKAKGEITEAAKNTITAPATVKLERTGDVFTASVMKKGETFQPIGSVTLVLTNPVDVGLAVCSHNVSVSETAIFSNVAVKNSAAKDAK